MDTGLTAGDADICAEAAKFRHVHEAVLENGFLDDALAAGQGHQGHELRLKIGSKAGINVRGHIHRLDGAGTLYRHGIEAAMNLATGLDQLVEQDRDQFRTYLGQAHFPTGHGASHGIGAGFDAIADHRPVGALEAGDAFDDDSGGTLTGNLGAHGVQAFGQVGDLRLAGGVFQHGRAMGQNGRHQGMFGSAYRHEREFDLGALQAARRLSEDITFVHVDMSAKRFQRLQVQIDRARTDGAAAGQRYLGVAGTGDQRPQHVERRTHLAHQIIGCEGRGNFRRMQQGFLAIGALRFSNLGAETRQQTPQQAGIGQTRHVGQAYRFGGQQGGGHQLDGRILRARNGDVSEERAAALDSDTIHKPACNSNLCAKAANTRFYMTLGGTQYFVCVFRTRCPSLFRYRRLVVHQRL